MNNQNYILQFTGEEVNEAIRRVKDGEFDGNRIISTTITYAPSTSGTTPPTNGWQSTIPTVEQGSYLWTRTVTTYTDGTSDTSYSVSLQGLNFTQQDRDDINNIINELPQIQGNIQSLQEDVAEIDSYIPSSTSPTNQLADKAFVNSSINNLAAFYITYNAAGDAFQTRAELVGATTFYSGGQPRVPTQNDYAIVLEDESQPKGVDGSFPTTRYSYQGGTYPNGQWDFQYVVNNTSLTQPQINAINSGITSTLVGRIFPPATTTPLMDGTGSAGNSQDYARGNHRHPTDTSRASTAVATTTANGLMSKEDKTKLNKIQDVQQLFRIGTGSTSETGYIKFAECTVDRAWNSWVTRLEFIDHNIVNDAVRPCGVEILVNTTNSALSVTTYLMYGWQTYLDRIYAVYNPSYAGGNSTVEFYYYVNGVYQEMIVKPLYYVSRPYPRGDVDPFIYVTNNQVITSLPTGTNITSRVLTSAAFVAWTDGGDAIDYLPLTGGTMTGVLTLMSSQTSGQGGMNCKNSTITNVNAIVLNDSDNQYGNEGFISPRADNTSKYDSISLYNGKVFLTTNMSAYTASDGTRSEMAVLGQIAYAECSTAADNYIKEVTIPGLVPSAGSSVTIRFTKNNTPPSDQGTQLKINGTVYNITFKGTSWNIAWKAGDTISFVYHGNLFWEIYSGYDLANYPVNCHVIQYEGESTPAARFGGTWEIDGDYLNRFLLPNSTSRLGEIGGYLDAVVVSHNHVVSSALQGGNTNYGRSRTQISSSGWTNGTQGWDDASVVETLTSGESGLGKNIPPYKIVAIWKRTA